jgi:hypothetical protein
VEEIEIFKRSSLLSIFLVVAIAVVGARTYQLWHEGPWALPQPSKPREPAPSEQVKGEPRVNQVASTKNIIENNLFDPERGAGTVQTEASAAGSQRIRKMILVGTVILGTSRYAILEEPSGAAPNAAKGQSSQLRLKVGDTIDGFKLSEVHEKNVVFTGSSSKVDLSLDFFRKAAAIPEKTPTPTPTRPGLAPRVPQTEKLPAPPVTR